MTSIKSQDLRAGMTVLNSLGIAVTLDHVEVFPARHVRPGWHMPACVLVFFGGNREHSHTFFFDEVLENVTPQAGERETPDSEAQRAGGLPRQTEG